jgi:hypothetical protein
LKFEGFSRPEVGYNPPHYSTRDPGFGLGSPRGV